MAETDLGLIHGPLDVERTIRAHLQLWLSTYLTRLAPAYTLVLEDTPVRSWRSPLRGTQLAEDQIPSVWVLVGDTREVARRSDRWEATWDVEVVVTVRGQDHDHTADMVGLYLTAVHAALTQPQAVGDLDSLHWVGESLDVLEPGSTRTIGLGTVRAEATYETAVDLTVELPEPLEEGEPVPIQGTVQSVVVRTEEL